MRFAQLKAGVSEQFKARADRHLDAGFREVRGDTGKGQREREGQ